MRQVTLGPHLRDRGGIVPGRRTAALGADRLASRETTPPTVSLWRADWPLARTHPSVAGGAIDIHRVQYSICTRLCAYLLAACVPAFARMHLQTGTIEANRRGASADAK